MTTTTKKKSKRPDGPGEPVMVRLQPPLAECIDDWRRRQPELPSRAEALRRLAEQALDAHSMANRGKRK